MKKILCAALAAMCMGSLFSGCTTKPDNKLPPAEPFKAPPEIGFMAAGQFDGYKLGTVSSLVSENTIKEHLPSSYISTYRTSTEGLHALTEEQIHGMVLPVLYADAEIARTPGINKIELTFIEKHISAIFLNDSNYVLPIDAAITSMKRTGNLKRIALSHSTFATEENAYVPTSDYEKVPNRVLKVGICSDDIYPFAYRDDNNNLVGVNVDVAHEFAATANAELEIKEYPKDKLEEALRNKEVDVILADFVNDEARYAEKSFSGLLFSDSYYDASTVIVAKNDYIGYSKDVLASLQAASQADSTEAAK